MESMTQTQTQTVQGTYDRIRGRFLVHALAAASSDRRLDELEVYYRRGTRPPRVGETLSVWMDGATPYAMAPLAD